VDRKSEDLESLEKVCLPLSLNLSQCLLELQQHQQVVELNDKLLEKHKGNFKATYQRARAHAALCHEDEARRDFDMVEKLDPKFKPFIRQELKKLGEACAPCMLVSTRLTGIQRRRSGKGAKKRMQRERRYSWRKKKKQIKGQVNLKPIKR
ncbi:unnamed protein product, partial [Tetraodon nigroviridis]